MYGFVLADVALEDIPDEESVDVIDEVDEHVQGVILEASEGGRHALRHLHRVEFLVLHVIAMLRQDKSTFS